MCGSRNELVCLYFSYRILAKSSSASGYPRTVGSLSIHIKFPLLIEHIRRFLFDQLNPDSEVFGMDVDLELCPDLDGNTRIKVFHSASAFTMPQAISQVLVACGVSTFVQHPAGKTDHHVMTVCTLRKTLKGLDFGGWVLLRSGCSSH